MMPVFVKKSWNESPTVFPAGCSVRVDGKVLSVLDANGKSLARFLMNTVEHYWTE